MDFTPREKETYRLLAGDIVLSEASGSPNQVGKPAIWNNEIEDCCFQNTVIRIRPKEIESSYLWVAFKHFYVSGMFARIAGGVGINHLSAHKFSRILLPLPPLSEQLLIANEVERRLSILDALEVSISTGLQRAEGLRQSILAEAFAGRLVPQDPSDESAYDLLERTQVDQLTVSKSSRNLRRAATAATK